MCISLIRSFFFYTQKSFESNQKLVISESIWRKCDGLRCFRRLTRWLQNPNACTRITRLLVSRCVIVGRPVLLVIVDGSCRSAFVTRYRTTLLPSTCQFNQKKMKRDINKLISMRHFVKTATRNEIISIAVFFFC